MPDIKNEYILEMNNITKTFPGVLALDNVTLKIKQGSIHALIGENGAGKSTLMKILNGVYQTTSGEIYLGGEKLKLHSIKEGQEKGISIIFQEFNLINTLSVAENIFLGRYSDSSLINWPFVRQQARELLERLGFYLDVNKIVGKLSAAEKQLVEIAKALSYQAKIIAMDEPTSSLTKKEVSLFFPVVERLKNSGITVIYITHKLDEIFNICDTVSILRDGKLVGESPVKEITRNQIIEKMVGRSLDIEFPARSVSPGDVIMQVKNLSQGKKLYNINFNLRRGEILGIAGLVGAGRTELAEAIFGAYPPDNGELVLKGKKKRIRSTYDGKNNSIGMVTEDRKETGLVLEMNVTKNITITKLDEVQSGPLLSNRKEFHVTKNYIEKLNIKTPSHNQQLNNLSGGNQQKVVLAKWLYSGSDVLIMDEPTRGIDVGAKFEIYNLMNALTEQGKAIIMISSELPEVLGMSDRILVMHEGTIKGELTGENKTAENVMQFIVQ